MPPSPPHTPSANGFPTLVGSWHDSRPATVTTIYHPQNSEVIDDEDDNPLEVVGVEETLAIVKAASKALHLIRQAVVRETQQPSFRKRVHFPSQ